MPAATAQGQLRRRPTDLLFIWMRAAAQGVGGGGASQLSAYNALVGSRELLSAEEWAECWAVCQIAPGVNIIAMALLTGSRLGGLAGAGASLAGLVAPSVVVTLLITTVYAHVAGTPVLQSGLHGLMAAAAAASFLNSWRLARPVLRASASQGPVVVACAFLVIVASGVLIRTTQVPVFALLLAGGCGMAATQFLATKRARTTDP